MKIMLDEGAFLPVSAHAADAGYDLKSREEYVIVPGGKAVIDTGVHFQIPMGVCGLLVSKSGLNVKRDMESTGLIDSGYTGSVVVSLRNHGDTEQVIHKGDKVSQIVFLPVLKYDFEIVKELKSTDRGDNGFGSTGR